MGFTAVTYNILATAYIRPDRYEFVPPYLLEPERRIPALVRHIESLDADLLCLQEVECDTFAALHESLTPLGYEGHYEEKGAHKPDGCATFFRTSLFALRHMQRLDFHDEERGARGNSGHVALLLHLDHEGHRLGVANTHLRWDKPGTPRDKQIGYRQIAELLEHCDPSCRGWLICGDFNCTEKSDIVLAAREAGYEPAHANHPHVRSCVANGRARLIDYLLHSGQLCATPFDPPAIEDDTVLPSEDQPSDHLALGAEFTWIETRS